MAQCSRALLSTVSTATIRTALCFQARPALRACPQHRPPPPPTPFTHLAVCTPFVPLSVSVSRASHLIHLAHHQWPVARPRPAHCTHVRRHRLRQPALRPQERHHLPFRPRKWQHAASAPNARPVPSWCTHPPPARDPTAPGCASDRLLEDLLTTPFRAQSPSQPTAMLDGLLRQLTAMDHPRVQSPLLYRWPEEQPSSLRGDQKPTLHAHTYAPPAHAESALTRSRSSHRGSVSSFVIPDSTSSAKSTSGRSHLHAPTPTSQMGAAAPACQPAASDPVSPLAASSVTLVSGAAFPMPPSGLQVPANPGSRARSLSHSNSTPSLVRPRSGWSHSAAQAASSSLRGRDMAGRAEQTPVPVRVPMLKPMLTPTPTPMPAPVSLPSPPRMTATRSHPGDLCSTTAPGGLSGPSLSSVSRVQPFDPLSQADLHGEACCSSHTSASMSASASTPRLDDSLIQYQSHSDSASQPQTQNQNQNQNHHQCTGQPSLLTLPAGPETDSTSASVCGSEGAPKPKFAKLRGLSDRLRGRVSGTNINKSAFMFPFVPSDLAAPFKKDQGVCSTAC